MPTSKELNDLAQDLLRLVRELRVAEPALQAFLNLSPTDQQAVLFRAYAASHVFAMDLRSGAAALASLAVKQREAGNSKFVEAAREAEEKMPSGAILRQAADEDVLRADAPGLLVIAPPEAKPRKKDGSGGKEAAGRGRPKTGFAPASSPRLAVSQPPLAGQPPTHYPLADLKEEDIARAERFMEYLRGINSYEELLSQRTLSVKLGNGKPATIGEIRRTFAVLSMAWRASLPDPRLPNAARLEKFIQTVVKFRGQSDFTFPQFVERLEEKDRSVDPVRIPHIRF